ncbi:MAG: RNA methyltransferase, partial [Neisseriaceae bacterium]|nr:RNA methyltransferase [Neisseriaceae bacterium]
VFGNEGAGVSPEITTLADYGVKIPMIGKTESLNVAMAASICLFEQMRQRMG